MKTFILADKQDIPRIGIRYLLEQPALRVETIEEAFTQTVLEALLTRFPDAVVILDLACTDFMTEKLLATLHTAHPEIHWLLFSDDIQEKLLDHYCANPRFSFVLKRCEINEINAALIYATKGENFICNPITQMLLHYRRDTNQNKENLTSTEKEILKAIALGKSAKEIASE
ncbi:MAG: DNA-binding response regulator [Tannerellaceae bacterium]|nr:DNA-binding response regulator [Tannerellaceae bacterium]